LAKLPISVLIDTYNHERFIEKAIVSVLEQDFPAPEREIIVVDDGSTDGTAKLVKKFQPDVRYLPKKNGGQASAFNLGIPQCQGEAIAFLDGDDYWLPGKLSRVAEVLAKNPSVGFVGHGIKECYADGRQNVVAPAKDERFTVNSLRAAQIFRMRRCYLGTSRMTMRAELARQILPVPEALVIEADEYLFTLAAVLSEVVILREALTGYVIHGGNLYFSAGSGRSGARRKQQVLEALAASFTRILPELGLSREGVNCIVEIIQAESDRERLMLDGGAPWETLRAENKLFEVLHADATAPQKLVRALTMIPASLLPARWFYAGRRWLGNRSWYRGLRKGALSIPEVTEAAGPEEFKA
jgi:hypothetical protein